MLAPPVSVPEEFSQESGTARFLGVAAITPTELAFARENGGDVLLEKLEASGAFPVIRPSRETVV